MATNGGRIEFQVGLNVETKSIQNLKTTLQNLQKIRPVDFSGSREELKEVQKTAAQVEEALKKAFNTNLGSLNVGKFNTELQQVTGGLDGIYRQFSKLGGQGQTAFSEIAKTALTSNFQLKETNSLIQQMGTTLVNTIKWNIASSAINGFTQEIQSAFTYVKSLDAALTDIRIVTGDSQQKMQQFAASANKAAQSLGRSTMDYTKSALTFYQQGLSDEDVQARTEAVLKAQNITGTGAEMADYMTAVWNGYKVANEEAELYVDKLAAVADSSASDMSQLAIAMSRVASTANNMGVDIDQLNAQIATVVATTRQAPESVGTAFKTIYTRLNDIKTGADEAEISLGNYSGKMASIGFNVLDTNGRLRDTGEIMEEIGERWQTLTKEQQIYLASTMGGQRQVNQLMALFNNWTTYSDLLNVSLESEGTLAEKNSRYMESLGAKMNQLAAAQQHVKSAMVDTDSWKAVLEILTAITDLFGTFVDSIGGGGTALLAFGSILMQVFSGPISQQLNNIITNLQKVKENAQMKEEDIAMTKLFAQSQGYKHNQATQAMVDAKQEIHKYYSFISAEEANAYNQIVKQIGATKQQVEQTENLQKQVQLFQQGITAAGNVVGASFTTALVNAVDVTEELSERIKNVSIRDFQATPENGTAFYKDLLQQLESVIGASNEAIPALATLQKLVKEGSTDFGALQVAARNALGQTQNLLNKDVQEIDASVKEAQASFELADGKKRQFLDSMESQAFARSIVESVSAVGRLAAGFQTLGNIVDTVFDSNVSVGDKITRTLTSIGFSLPMIVTSYGQLKQVIEATDLMQEKHNATLAKQTALKQKDMAVQAAKAAREKADALAKEAQDAKNAAAQAKQRAEQILSQQTYEAKLKATVAAKKASKAATQAETIATTAETAATNAQAAASEKEAIAKQAVAKANLAMKATLGVTAALIAVGLAVKLWERHKQKIKEATEAAERFNQTVADLSKKNNENQSRIKELKELQEEYDKLSKKAGSYDSNINSLSESEKKRWAEIKNTIAEINPDIVGAYTEQGQAILNNNDAIRETIDLLKEQNKQALNSYVKSEDFNKARQGRKIKYGEASSQAQEATNNLNRKASSVNFYNQKENLEQLINDIGPGELQDKLFNLKEKLDTSTLREIAENGEEYKKQLKNALEEVKITENDFFSGENFLKNGGQQLIDNLISETDAFINKAFDAMAKQKAALSKEESLSDANVSAVMMQLMYSDAKNAQFESLTKMGITSAESMITAFVNGIKEGRVSNEEAVVQEARAFEDNLITLFSNENNGELQEKLQKANQDYQKQSFKTVKEREEYLLELFNSLAKDIDFSGIKDANVFTTLFNAFFGTDLQTDDIDFSEKKVNQISASWEKGLEKAAGEIARFTGNEDFDFNLLKDFEGLDNIDLSYIISELGKVKDNNRDWRDILTEIIAKYGQIQEKQSLITSLSSITQTGEKLQSGKSVSAKDQTEYRKSIQQIIDAEQLKSEQEQDKVLIDAGKILLDSYLAGSQAYEKALKYFTDSQVQLMTQQAKLTQQPLTDQQFEDIARTLKTVEDVQNAYDSGIIKDYAHYQALLNKVIRQGLKDMKKSPQLQKEYSKYLQQTQKNVKSSVDNFGNFRKNIELTNEEYDILAFNTLKANDALEKFQKTFKNSKISSKEDIIDGDGLIRPEMIESVSEMVSFLNEVPGLDIDNNQFIKYFDTILELVHGTEGALGELRQKLAQEQIKIEIDAGLADPDLQGLLNDVNNKIASFSPEEIQTHAYLHDEEFVRMLNELQTKSVEAKRICDRILQSIGAKADVKIKEFKRIPIQQRLKDTGMGIGRTMLQNQFLNQSFGTQGGAGELVIPIPEITFKPLTDEGTTPISPGSSGGKGGGGGGGSQGKALSKKDQKKEDLDPYHDINRQLERINKQYSLLEKNEEKLVGTDLIDNLTDQNKLLDKNIGLLRQKYDIGEEERKKKAEKIAPLGVEFDERGEITNYNEIRQKLLDEYNALIKEWNELAEAGTALPEEERKKKEEDLKEAQKKYEENKKNIDDYLEHLDTQADVQLQIKDEEEKKIQNEIKKFKIKIDLHIDYSEALRDWRDFEDKVIDQLRDDDIFGNIESRFKNIFTYFDEDDIGKSLVGDLTDQVNGTLDQIEKMKNGISQIYGNNMAQAMQDLDKNTQQLMSSLTSVKDLMEEIKQSFFDLVNKAQESFDEQTDEYEALASWIEHDRRLMELLYGDEAYEKFQKFDQKQAEVDLKQLDFYQKQKDFWWEQMEAQKARMAQLDKQSNAYKEAEERFKELEKHWLDTAKTLNSTIEQSIENLITKYEDSIDAIFGDLDKKLTNGKGLQPLAEEWQLIKDIQDDYLDDVDKIYEVDKLENAVKDAIKDNENNPKAQQALNKFMQDRVDILKEQDKLTQYDIDHANKALEIELKRIALQDSRNSKTRLRLKRDASGNYSYQFVADEEEGENKLQELKDLQHQLYTLDKDKLQELKDEYLSSLGDFFARVREMEKSNATDEQIENFTSLSYQKFDNLSDMILRVRNNLPEDMWDSIEGLDGYLGMTEEQFKNLAQTEQQEFLGKTVPGWKDGVSDMIDTITAEGGLEAACQGAFKRLDQVTEDYQNRLKALENTAKINFEEISKGVNDTAAKTETLLETNEGLIKTYEEEFGTMEGVIGQLQSIAGAYGQIKEAAEEAAKAALEAKKAIAIDPQAYSNNDEDEEKVSNKPNYKTFIQEPIKASGDSGQVQSSNSNSSVVGPGANLSSNNSTVYIPKKKTRRYHTNTGFKGAFATGGYTGSWGDEGKLAILHEKELVLNKDDTTNILAAVSLMRHINSALNPALSNLNIPSLPSTSSNTTSVDQQVHIQASFPNVQDRNEIEQAFNNLINRASQYAFNTDR